MRRGTRTHIVFALMLVMVAGSARASDSATDGAVQDRGSVANGGQFTLNLVNQGKPAAIVPIEALGRGRDRPVAVGTTDASGDIDVPDVLGVSRQRMEVYVCTADDGGQVVILVQPGVDPSKDPRCDEKHRRRLGGFIWGDSRTVRVDLQSGVSAGNLAAGAHRPWIGESALRGDMPPHRIIGARIEGALAPSTLANTARSCTNFGAFFRQRFGLNNATCDFPSRALSLGAGASLDVTSFAGLKVYYQNVRQMAFKVSAQAANGRFVNEDLTFGSAGLTEVAGVGRLPLGPIVPYLELGMVHWHLDQTQNLNVTDTNGAKLSEVPTARTDSGWSRFWATGVQVNITGRCYASFAFENVRMRKDDANPVDEHYNQARSSFGVRF